VLFHTGDTATSDGSLVHSHPLTLDALSNERPRLRIVACHFGNPWFDDVGELIYKHENIYADVSGLTLGGGAYQREYVRRLAQRISGAIYFAGSAEKVLFGTDYPVTLHTIALGIVRALAISDEDKARILTDNAAELFRL